MELRELRYFWTVAEERNFSKAAKVLHITQPTLSRQIREFEERLGTPLFIRDKRALRLTDEGYFLKERAAEILLLADNTEQALQTQKRINISGHLSIGCVEADNSDTLAMMLEELTSDYPQVTFNIVSGISNEISDKLEKGIIDIAILLEPVSTAEFETIVLPRTEKWGLLVSNNSFLTQKKTVGPIDLEGIPLLCTNRREVQTMLSCWLNKPISSLNIIGTFNLIFNIIPLVENQVGSALTIEGAILDRERSMLTFIPLVPKLETNCVLVWKKNRIQTPVVKEFIQRVKSSFC